MKILLVDSGVSTSTADVFRGYGAAFERAGHTVVRYMLSARIDQANWMLQRAWDAAGNPEGRRPTGADIYFRASEGVPAFALRHMPDLVLVVTSQFLHPDILVFLDRAGFKVGIIATESPYGDHFQAHFLQAAACGWTQERASVERLREWSGNPNVWYLPAAHDPTLHHPDAGGDDPATPAHDVVIVGTAFEERVRFLEAVDWSGIDLGLYGDWRTLRDASPLTPFVRGGLLDNATAAMLYRKARIGVNLYRDGLILAGEPAGTLTYAKAQPVAAESLSPRAYELAACGCFQISQYRAEVAETFGASVPCVDSPAMLADIVREMLARPERRTAWAAQAVRMIQGHTFDARAAQLLDQADSIRRATGPVALAN